MIPPPIVATGPIIGQSASAALAALRSPPWLPDGAAEFIFHGHWAYWIALALIGIALATRPKPALRRGGLVLIAMAVLWVIVAQTVDTPRERLWNAHAAILAAAQANDPKAIEALLTPNFQFGSFDRAAMSTAIDEAFKNIKIKSTTVRNYEADIQYPAAQSQISLFTTLEKGQLPEGPHPTRWQLLWTDVPNEDWRISSIQQWYYGDQMMPQDFGAMR